ncbi:MAG: hypothetical protein M1358_00220, partial [Chloroflexi bacterium]|nr:hypothetical protein [Chloroflexota bacterium]
YRFLSQSTLATIWIVSLPTNSELGQQKIRLFVDLALDATAQEFQRSRDYHHGCDAAALQGLEDG